MDLNQKLPSRSFQSVELVESVENPVSASGFQGKRHPVSYKGYSTKTHPNPVGIVTKNDLSSYFSTLSTEIKRAPVEKQDHSSSLNANSLNNVPRIPRVPRGKANECIKLSADEKESIKLIFEWMQVALDEGHIEPSQSTAGKIIGWPCRSFSIESLFIDFDLWCRRQGVARWAVPEKRLFFFVVDEILHREGNQYGFPPLNDCRAKFALFKVKYESL